MQIPELPFRSISLQNTPWVYESRPYIWKPPPFDHYVLSIGIEGEITLSHNEAHHTQGPWQAVILPPDSHNRGERQAMFTNFSAHFSIDPPADQHALPFIKVDLAEVDLCQSLIHACMQIALDDDPLSKQQKELAVLHILTLVWRSHKKPRTLSSRDHKIYEQTNRFRAGKDLFKTTSELAEEVNMSRVHYSNCFKQLFKKTPNQYLIQRRVEKACILLRTTEMTLETIS